MNSFDKLKLDNYPNQMKYSNNHCHNLFWNNNKWNCKKRFNLKCKSCIERRTNNNYIV